MVRKKKTHNEVKKLPPRGRRSPNWGLLLLLLLLLSNAHAKLGLT